MIFLILAVACSTGIAVIFRVTEGRYDRFALLAVNYAVAVVVAGARIAPRSIEGTFAIESGALLLGIALGALFITGFALFSKAIGMAGLSLATATMRLSVAIPFVASWLVWGEVPSVSQGVGLMVAGWALVLITRPRVPATGGVAAPPGAQPRARAGRLAMAAILLLLFLNGGLVDTALKLFEEQFADGASRALFLLFAFGAAFTLGATAVVARRWRGGPWPRRGVLGWGALLGATNYASVEFILLALHELPGTVVFPANNVAIVACATFVGMIVWRERLSMPALAGIVLAALALILLAF